MHSTLFPTQIEDVNAIAASEDLPNFSQPGTGKTLTTIGAIEAHGFSSVLVSCPVIAAPMWAENLERELGAVPQIISRRDDVIDYNADAHIITYGLLKDHFDGLADLQADALVLDESQYLKNWEADRTQVIFGPECDGKNGLYSTCRQAWCLSGTPIERYNDDLWSQLRATQPGALYNYNALSLKEFQGQFCIMELKEYGGGAVRKWVSTKNQNERLLNRMLYNKIGIIRRTMDEVEKHMPPVTMREIFTRAKIGRELQDLLKGLTIEQIEALLLDGGDRINRAYRLTGIAKTRDTVNYIKSIAVHRPVLVGFWHHDVGREIYTQLTKDKFAVAYIDGSTSMEARERRRIEFNKGELDVLVGQIASMGVAMNLQETGSHVIMAEDHWSPSKIEQFWKRVWRLGQTKHVQVDFCRSDIPVDTALRNVRERKAHGASLVLNAPDRGVEA